jgi:hypothetical protein
MQRIISESILHGVRTRLLKEIKATLMSHIFQIDKSPFDFVKSNYFATCRVEFSHVSMLPMFGTCPQSLTTTRAIVGCTEQIDDAVGTIFRTCTIRSIFHRIIHFITSTGAGH